jgi:hypothetical protein
MKIVARKDGTIRNTTFPLNFFVSMIKKDDIQHMIRVGEYQSIQLVKQWQIVYHQKSLNA